MEWISVKDRLPSEYQTIIIFDPYSYYRIYVVEFYKNDIHKAVGYEHAEWKRVTHWMPVESLYPDNPKTHKCSEHKTDQ